MSLHIFLQPNIYMIINFIIYFHVSICWYFQSENSFIVSISVIENVEMVNKMCVLSVHWWILGADALTLWIADSANYMQVNFITNSSNLSHCKKSELIASILIFRDVGAVSWAFAVSLMKFQVEYRVLDFLFSSWYWKYILTVTGKLCGSCGKIFQANFVTTTKTWSSVVVN